METENLDKSELQSRLFDGFAGTSTRRYVYVCNMATGVSRWSRNAVEYFDLPGEYFLNAGEIWADHIHPSDREMYLQDIDDVFSGRKARHELDYRARNKDGEYVACSCQGVVLKGEPDLFVGAITNHGIMDNIDATTNLYNIFEFWKKIREVRESKKKHKVLYVGVNTFSEINAIYGYAIGDKVLRALGDNLLEMVKGKGTIYRMDGVCFACILPEMSVEEVEKLYADMQYVARNNIYIDNVRISISLSGGVVDYQGEYDEYMVQANARQALHQSKRKYHGELSFFDNKLLDDNRRNLELLDVLRKSILNNCEGYYLCYQPIVGTGNELIVGAESLLRWHGEPFGEVPPGMFIPMLENDPIFYNLGNWILKQAMTDGKQFLDKYPDFVLNVNIAYTQLSRVGFLDTVRELLEETGFPPKNLCLELTERCRQLEKDFLQESVNTLRKLGIKVAIDDFGTGTSSLNLLSELRVNTLKIDRGFVWDIQTNEANQAIVEAITNCAMKLNVRVCCEGVETREMVEFLRRYPVYSIQGYYYSKPIPLADFQAKYC